MRQAKNKPYILDDQTIERCLKLYLKQNKDCDLFLQRCAVWKREKLTEKQIVQVQEIESIISTLVETNKKILSIANDCIDSNIDSILKKDDIELALDLLTGKDHFLKCNLNLTEVLTIGYEKY